MMSHFQHPIVSNGTVVADDLNTTVESDDAEKVDEEPESQSHVTARSDPRYEVLLFTLQELFDAKGDAVPIDELQDRLSAQSSDPSSEARLLRQR